MPLEAGILWLATRQNLVYTKSDQGDSPRARTHLQLRTLPWPQVRYAFFKLSCWHRLERGQLL